MKVKVTQQDIDNGERGNYELCPVALATKRAVEAKLPNNYIAAIQMESRFADVYIGDTATEYRLPEDVTRRIRHFDDYGDMQPFEFELIGFDAEGKLTVEPWQ